MPLARKNAKIPRIQQTARPCEPIKKNYYFGGVE